MYTINLTTQWLLVSMVEWPICIITSQYSGQSTQL